MELTVEQLLKIIDKGICERQLIANHDVYVSLNLYDALDEDAELEIIRLNIAYVDNNALILSSVPLSTLESASYITQVSTVEVLKQYISKLIADTILLHDSLVILECGYWMGEYGTMTEEQYYLNGDSAYYSANRKSLDRAIISNHSLYLFHAFSLHRKSVHIGIAGKKDLQSIEKET